MSAISENRKFRIRPRFNIEYLHSVEKVHAIISDKISSAYPPFNGKSTIGFVSLYPHEKDHHYWSPYLSVIVEESENGSLLRGHYGPSPPVWTMFVFLYAVIGLSTVILTVIGFANKSIGLSSAVLWLVPILLMAFFSLYYASYIGQKKGHKQIEEIHLFFEDCIGQEIQ